MWLSGGICGEVEMTPFAAVLVFCCCCCSIEGATPHGQGSRGAGVKLRGGCLVKVFEAVVLVVTVMHVPEGVVMLILLEWMDRKHPRNLTSACIITDWL
ncbi:uncharacterized protein EI90DRAFT_3061937 [Cantharellus anzutake]|uniref:uncharacterized protein n=1 Tax=Cantharellus anzutake TaxID=1750568 RepID=UPI001906F879|nr:uncharacterized protein EI90DRAFT_3061937 [Cantharellus anzutake]KAF8329775.1 hypothetical protein EI90DRAFT_3061937 [Cantharellus anzutake]